MASNTIKIIITVVITLTCIGCQRSANDPERFRGSAKNHNIIIITLDTTRADRLGCYGYPQAHTPNIDAIAAVGIRFDRAYTHVPITLPSHTCLMTGTRPPENGVRLNGKRALGSDLPTLAELHHQNGYSTAAFLAAAVLDHRYGLERGFDLYDDDMSTDPRKIQGQRTAGNVCDRALAWLNTRVGDGPPFMCWIHFFDPHIPYSAPERFTKLCPDHYDAEVAYMDEQLGRILNWLDEKQLREKTLLVVVGDHGESLGEHNFPWHSLLLYRSIVRIPLIISLPGALPENKPVNDIVQISDIMPTMLELIGQPTPEQISGRSLCITLCGTTLKNIRVYGETNYPLDSFGWSPLRYLIDDNWKYIRAPIPELYDLANDPGEVNNLATTNPQRITDLETALREVEAGMVTHATDDVQLAAAELATLQGLGYVGDTGEVEPDQTIPLKNPLDMVDVYIGYRDAEQYLNARRAVEAIEILDPLTLRSPESYVIIALLAKAYAGAGMLECAQGLLHETLALSPDSTGPLLLLARIYDARGASARAIKVCSRVLEISPNDEEAKNLLPALHEALSRQNLRLRELQKQVRDEPELIDSVLLLTKAYLGCEQYAEAIETLRSGLVHHPDDPRLTSALAWQLATTPIEQLRDGPAAWQLAHSACSDSPTAESLDILAAALAETGRFEEAADTARRAIKIAQKDGRRAFAAVINRRLRLFENRTPYRSPS